MGRNPEWFDQQRARGICYICKQKMDDSEEAKAHSRCYRLAKSGKKFKETREIIKRLEMRNPNAQPSR